MKHVFIRYVRLAVLFWLLTFSTSFAHEVRPAYLSLTETAPAEFSFTWKQPVIDGQRLKIKPTFPEDCKVSDPKMTLKTHSVIESRMISCSLTEGIIAFKGLEHTLSV